jgi:hypothetical protein
MTGEEGERWRAGGRGESCLRRLERFPLLDTRVTAFSRIARKSSLDRLQSGRQHPLHLYVTNHGASFFLLAEGYFHRLDRRKTAFLGCEMGPLEPEQPRTWSEYRIFSINSAHRHQ